MSTVFNVRMLLFFFFLVLGAITVVSYRHIEKYEPVSGQLLHNSDFSAGLNCWKIGGSPGGINIRNGVLGLHAGNVKSSVQVWQQFMVADMLRHANLQLQASVCCEDVVKGNKPWNVARLLLVQYVHGKPRYNTAHVVCALSGSHDWQKVSNTFTLLPDCTEFRVIVQMSHCSGSFFLRDVKLSQVKQTALYSWTARALRIAWVVFVVLLFVPWLDFRNVMLPAILVVMTVIVILFGTTMPGHVKNTMKKEVIREIRAGVQSVRDPAHAVTHSKKQPDDNRVPVDITKVAHFVLFGVLALLLRRCRPERPTWLLMLDLFLLSCATELSQLFIDGRTALFSDVLIDLAGGGTGCLLAGKWVAGILEPK